MKQHPDNNLYPILPFFIESKENGKASLEHYAEQIPIFDSRYTMDTLKALGLTYPTLTKQYLKEYVLQMIPEHKLKPSEKVAGLLAKQQFRWLQPNAAQTDQQAAGELELSQFPRSKLLKVLNKQITWPVTRIAGYAHKEN